MMKQKKCTEHKWENINVNLGWGRKLYSYAKCRRCGKTDFIPVTKSPMNDKRNFRRSDPRYAEYQKLLVDTNGQLTITML